MIGILTRNSTRISFPSALLAAVFVLAFLIRSIIPAGFMPELRSGQMVSMVICTGMGLTVVSFDAGRTDDHGKVEKHDTVCPFAFSAMPSKIPVVFTLGLPLLAVRAAICLAALFRSAESAVKPWFSQGPPPIL